jgi:hypothetical protein
MSTDLGTIDHGGDGKDVLIAVLNHIYGESFTLDDFDFGTPEPVILPDPTHNSKIKLGPKAHTGYYGFRTIYYNRIHVSELGPIKVPYDGENYLTQVLDKINNKYGILIKPTDIYEQVLTPPVPPETNVNVELNFKPDSLVFYGGDMITLGPNDPSLEFDSPINLPFAVETAFFVNNNYKVQDGLYTEYSSVALATDYERQKSSRIVNTNDDEFTRMSKSIYTEEQFEKLKGQLPFVFTWNVENSKRVRGLTLYGDILELAADGSEWTYVNNLLGLTGSTSNSVLNQIRNKPFFKGGTQGADGKVYFIKRNDDDNTVDVLVSEDFGETVSVVSQNREDEQFNIYNEWDNTQILDMLAVGHKLYMLVKTITPYPTVPGKGILTPSVEIFNTITGETEYYPLADITLKNTNIGLSVDDNSIFKFVSPNDDNNDFLDVVALTGVEKTKTPIVVYFKDTGTNYEAELVPFSDIEPTALTNSYYDISAYTRKLYRNDNYLLSINLIGRVDSEHIDFEHYLNTYEKTETGFYNFGLTTLTTVTDRDKYSEWTETVKTLGSGMIPKAITITNYGKRTNYVFQGEVGIFKTDYEENEHGIFNPVMKLIFSSGTQSGYNMHSAIGAGQFSKLSMNEYHDAEPDMFPYSNGELSKNQVNYSFMVKSDTGEYKWLVAENENDTLSERSFSAEYSLLGKRPLNVAAMDGNLYAWSENGRSVFYSENAGRIWLPYAATLTYYEDAHSEYDATAHLGLTPSSFKAGSFKNDKLIYEINYSNNLTLINKTSRLFDEVLSVKDNVLYELTDEDPDLAVQFSSVYSTRGLNVLSKDSPRRIITWDTDTDNDVLAISEFSVNRNTLYGEQVNTEVLHDDVEDDVVLVDFDLVYVGLKHLAVTKNDQGEYKIIAVKEDDTTDIYDLEDDQEDLYEFKPTIGWHLWEYTDTDDLYTPYVLLGDKELVMVERVDIAGDYSLTRHSLTIPNDNASDLLVIPMLSDNRREFLLYQKGNGIFKIHYEWDIPDRTSEVSLVRIFNLVEQADLDFINGAYLLGGPVEPYGEVKVPVIPAYGEVLDTVCRGVNKVEIRADGRMGSFEVVIEENSEDCGYIPPVPGDIEDGGTDVNTGP